MNTSITVNASENNPSDARGPGDTVKWSVRDADEIVHFRNLVLVQIRDHAVNNGQSYNDGEGPANSHYNLIFKFSKKVL
jgi:hypothetical protein